MVGELRPFVQWTKEAQRTPGRKPGWAASARMHTWKVVCWAQSVF